MDNYHPAITIVCFSLIASVALPLYLTDFVYDIRASMIDDNNLTGFNASSGDLPSDLDGNMTTNENESRNVPTAGSLQIPYTGLVRNQITPEISNMLGLNSSTFGMMVSEVVPDSPAEKAGFQAGNITRSVGGNIIRIGGDIILAIDGNTSFVRSSDAYQHYLRNEKKVGENLTFTILRGGDLKEINLTIGAVPMFFWHDDPDEGIKIAYPSDWEVSETNLKRDDVVKFFSPEENPSNGLPTAGLFLKVLSAGEFGLDTLARQETERKGPVRNLHMTFTDLGGLPAYESVFYDYENQSRTLKTLRAFTLKDGDQIYRVNYAADPWKYEEYLPIARKMIDSFQFTTVP